MGRFFSLGRLFAMLAKESIQMRRDRITFAMMLGVPLMQLLLFGYAINTDPKELPAALVAPTQDRFTRAMVTAILNGSLKSADFETDPIFGLSIPKTIPNSGVPANVLNPRNTWADKSAYDIKAKDLAKKFRDNDAKFEMSDAVRGAGPRG